MRTFSDGSRETITYKKAPNQRPGTRSWTRKIIGPDGRTQEVWHEVMDSQGNYVHQHLKFGGRCNVAMRIEEPSPPEVTDTVDAFRTILDRAPLPQVEAILAFLAITVTDRVERGHMEAGTADRLFTLIDVQLTDAGRDEELSENATQLVVEGHHFHHWGGEWSADPDRIRSLAFSILAHAG